MRWERLFQDLEDQLEYETDAERDCLARDEERLRVARLRMVDRLRALASHSAPERCVLRIRTTHVECELRVLRLGRDWLLAEIESPVVWRSTALVPIVSIRQVALSQTATGMSLTPENRDVQKPRLSNDIGLAFVLRDLARRRRHVIARIGCDEISGTIERVGLDHFDIAVHDVDRFRNDERISGVEMVSFDHLDIIQLV